MGNLHFLGGDLNFQALLVWNSLFTVHFVLIHRKICLGSEPQSGGQDSSPSNLGIIQERIDLLYNELDQSGGNLLVTSIEDLVLSYL